MEANRRYTALCRLSHRVKNVMNGKPDIVENNHLLFLDDLRESGITNMSGATSYLERMFGVNSEEADTIFFFWMDTFHERHDRYMAL